MQPGHGQGRRQQQQQLCSAGGEAMPSSVRSRGRTGGGTEVVLISNPTVKSSHKVQQLLFSPSSCVLQLLYSKIVIIMSTKRAMVSVCY